MDNNFWAQRQAKNLAFLDNTSQADINYDSKSKSSSSSSSSSSYFMYFCCIIVIIIIIILLYNFREYLGFGSSNTITETSVE